MEIESLGQKEQLSTVRSEMDEILQGLAATEGLIIDVRFNGGGSDEFALAIARYFADSTRLVFNKENYNIADPTPQQPFYLEPYANDAAYTKPVTVISGPDTGSAAEIFVMAMKTLPNVAHIGEATEGILSDELDIQLMEGWNLGLSYQIYYDADGNVHESTGLLPTKEVPVTSYTGLNAFGALPAIHQALTDFNVDLSITEDEFNTVMVDIVGDIGLSVAWIDSEQVIGSAVAGFADIEAERPVTTGTPFTLGSVSKTFIGTSVMQMVERNLINLDTTLGELAMPFTVDSPYKDGSDIVLIDLVTHTSGIRDDDLAYNCGYYLEADFSSFFALFDDAYSDCPSPVETNQSAFLASVLNASGALYSDTHFVDVEPGEGYFYTNVGSALAAEMLAVASGADFDRWTENNIFSPLGMNSTHWFSSDFSDSDIAPVARYVALDGSEGDVTRLPDYSLATWSDGGLKSTSIDLARYLLAVVRKGELDGQRILCENSVSYMLNAAIDEITAEGDQGVFWTNDNFMFGHNGGDPGVETEMRYDHYNQMGVIVMHNGSLVIPDKAKRLLNHLVYRRGLSLKDEILSM